MDQETPTSPPAARRLQVHESIPPLLRGIGSTIILLAAIIGASHTKPSFNAIKPAPSAEIHQKESEAVEELTREVAELREAAQEENVVNEVLANPWFEGLGTLGSAIIAASFYADWLSKRPKR
jgi:hypothetical protein